MERIGNDPRGCRCGRLEQQRRRSPQMPLDTQILGSAAAPGVAFPAELLAAARGFGIMTEYFRAREGRHSSWKENGAAGLAGRFPPSSLPRDRTKVPRSRGGGITCRLQGDRRSGPVFAESPPSWGGTLPRHQAKGKSEPMLWGPVYAGMTPELTALEVLKIAEQGGRECRPGREKARENSHAIPGTSRPWMIGAGH